MILLLSVGNLDGARPGYRRKREWIGYACSDEDARRGETCPANSRAAMHPCRRATAQALHDWCEKCVKCRRCNCLSGGTRHSLCKDVLSFAIVQDCIDLAPAFALE